MGHFYNSEIHGLRTPSEAFFIEIQNFQTNWADKFGAFGVFSAEYQQYFWYSESLSMFSIILQNTKPLYPHPNIYLGLGFEFGLYRISVLAYVCP